MEQATRQTELSGERVFIRPAMDQAKAQLNLSASATFGNLPDSERQPFLQEVIARIEPYTEQWRRGPFR
jgi:hypothetical protein